jgi:hypothetical protein
MRSIKLLARTEVILVIPSTKQIASRIFDFPEPFNPVMALKDSSNPGVISPVLFRMDSGSPVMVVRTGYDLKPKISSLSGTVVN